MQNVTRGDEYRAVSRSRGLLLGLALGDTAGQVARGAGGPLVCGVATQLAAFVTEGSIRAIVRAHHRGIGGLVGPIWRAYARWAALQGIQVHGTTSSTGDGVDPRPNGWLATVPELRERRGSAPATVAALQSPASFGGTVAEPVTGSAGAHAVTSVLPTSVVGAIYRIEDWFSEAQAVAALTHGARAGHEAAATASVIAAACFQRGDLNGAVEDGLATAVRRQADPAVSGAVSEAARMAADRPRDAQALLGLAGNRSAAAALAGGTYAALSFPQPDQVDAATAFAARAHDAPAAAAVAGALLGATHGAEALPVPLVSRLDLAWVLDTLARDLVTELLHHPSGDEYTEAEDPFWWSRYPGG